jgi:serine/threonine-protein kinase
LSGRFEILHVAGRGGMGDVYAACDLELGATVALKLIRPGIAGRAEAVERLKDEIRAARQISHPHVCRIHDWGRHVAPGAEPLHFLTMEWVEGETLAGILADGGSLEMPRAERGNERQCRSCAANRSPPSSDQRERPSEKWRATRWRLSGVVARRCLDQIASGLDAIHAAGIVHGDLTAANVVLRRSALPGSGLASEAVIIDFGLARRVEMEVDGEIPGGGPLGALACMAPERWTGGPATRASDVYAFGLLVREVLAATREGASPAYRALISGCLAARPDRRFWSAGAAMQFARGARQSRAGATLVIGSPPEPPRAAWPWRPAWKWAGAAGLVLASCMTLHRPARANRAATPVTVLLTPVANSTREPRLDGVTDMLRLQLAQARHLRVVSDPSVSRRDPADLTRQPGLGREAARRQGAALVIFSDLVRVADSYRLELEVERVNDNPARARQRWDAERTLNTPTDLAASLRDAAQWVDAVAADPADQPSPGGPTADAANSH